MEKKCSIFIGILTYVDFTFFKILEIVFQESWWFYRIRELSSNRLNHRVNLVIEDNPGPSYKPCLSFSCEFPIHSSCLPSSHSVFCASLNGMTTSMFEFSFRALAFHSKITHWSVTFALTIRMWIAAKQIYFPLFVQFLQPKTIAHFQ